MSAGSSREQGPSNSNSQSRSHPSTANCTETNDISDRLSRLLNNSAISDTEWSNRNLQSSSRDNPESSNNQDHGLYESQSFYGDHPLPTDIIDESLTSVRNIVRKKIKHLDSSSGSDDDLNLEARRVMRQRKKEKERLEKLGPMVPLVLESDADPVTPSGSILDIPAIALRSKRAETELNPGTYISEIFQGELVSYHSSADLSQKSALVSDVRNSRKSGVNFSVVEQLVFTDDETPSTTTSITSTTEI